MFSWLRRKQPSSPPATLATPPGGAGGGGDGNDVKTASDDLPRLGENPANPGITTGGRVAFTDGERSWEEQFDCIKLLAGALIDQGYRLRAEGQVLVEERTGLSLRPLVVTFKPIPNKGVQTVTTIEVKHPTLIPMPIFEFQHSTGHTMIAAIRAGFDQWCQTDFVTLADATRAEPSQCMQLVMELPAKGDRPAMKRRVVLGPVAHLRQNPPDPSAAPEEHPFCPCCLFTRSMEAFVPVIESSGVFGLRLFALRDERGGAQADCRANGEDFNAGKAGLLRYVGTWPGSGVEFRKQYVLIQDAP